MYVPNFVPEPIEVPGNVTEQSYGVRLRFVKQVTAMHTVSVLTIALIALMLQPDGVSVWQKFATAAVVFVALDLVRIASRSQRIESIIASVGLIAVMLSVAWTVRALSSLPMWSLVFGPVWASVYAFSCGRDYSFVGNFAISLVGSSLSIVVISKVFSVANVSIAIALSLNAVYFFYVIYDLASLQSRRRPEELLPAVTDLYRDIFNIFGYVPRVIRHWRTHKIWGIPRSQP